MFGTTFKTETYAQAYAETRVLVESGDQSWRETVDVRYARFLVRRAAQLLQLLEAELDAVAHAPDQVKFYAHYGEQMAAAARSTLAACSLLTGQFAIADPVKCETVLRTYEQFSQPLQEI